MKINKKELFSIEDLTKEELLFLFEVIEKMQLSPESSPLSKELAEKFKAFRIEIVGDVDSKSLQCETCGDVGTEVVCPLTDKMVCLCERDYEHRKVLAKQINE